MTNEQAERIARAIENLGQAIEKIAGGLAGLAFIVFVSAVILALGIQ